MADQLFLFEHKSNDQKWLISAVDEKAAKHKLNAKVLELNWCRNLNTEPHQDWNLTCVCGYLGNDVYTLPHRRLVM